jgi:hypothetical protein
MTIQIPPARLLAELMLLEKALTGHDTLVFNHTPKTKPSSSWKSASDCKKCKCTFKL